MPMERPTRDSKTRQRSGSACMSKKLPKEYLVNGNNYKKSSLENLRDTFFELRYVFPLAFSISSFCTFYLLFGVELSSA
jgi:hypothetical protein